MSLYSVAPCRMIDTRTTDAPALAAGFTRTFVLTGDCGIPSGAQAVSLNVTVTQATSAGWLQLFPAGTPSPSTSTISFGVNQTRANNAVVAVGPSGDVSVECDMPLGTVQLIVDVNGYFQ